VLLVDLLAEDSYWRTGEMPAPIEYQKRTRVCVIPFISLMALMRLKLQSDRTVSIPGESIISWSQGY